jgi:outer membrane protein TolC
MKGMGQTGALWLALAAALLGGCTAQHYRESADKAAYAAIAQKSWQVKNMDPHFTIEQTNAVALDGLPEATQTVAFLGEYAESERGARIVNLDTALEVGVRQSRTYQSRKEQLYLSALGLTLDRHRFVPLFSAGGNADYGGGTYPTTVTNWVTNPSDPLHPIPVYSDQSIVQNSVTAKGSVNASWLIRDLGRITASLTVGFQKFLTGGPQGVANSEVVATFTRPLLRNAGFKNETETLTQGERDLLYALRDFTRYRKDFTVEVATAYYGVLGARDAARNAYLNLQSSHQTAERGRALAREGRQTQSDLGRLEQQELSTESTWIAAVRNYKQSLDNFKILLGLSTGARIVLDDADLNRLKVDDPQIALEDSIRVALAARLDYQNVQDQLADSERKVGLAADNLKTQLDLTAQANSSSTKTKNGVELPDFKTYNWSAGVILDLPIERTAERNAYRQALINRDQAARTVTQREDDITLEVRDSWRSLEQAKRTYEISEIGVKLAERRVEEQNLLAELGRAKAQDQVDAQNDLVNSLNQRTQALVTHTIARLQFWNRLGILYIKDNGQWEEVSHASAQ